MERVDLRDGEVDGHFLPGEEEDRPSSQVPREYLLAVTSGRIAVVATKVFELSPLSIVRSNRLARLNV